METDVLIIGGGVIGSAIARELSKYKIKLTLIEKEADIAFGGPTKANTGIVHAGYDDEPGTIEAELCVRGNRLWSTVASELAIPFKRSGSFVVALEDSDIKILETLKLQGSLNKVPDLEIIEGTSLFGAEPNLNTNAIAGLSAPSAGIISPYEAAIALAENARENGARILLETEALSIAVTNGKVKSVKTDKGEINPSRIVNAAGLFSDKISSMVGLSDFQILPRKGEYLIYDNALGEFVKHPLFPVPTPISKGILVSPTVDGNMLVGPNACDVNDKDDSTTTSCGIEEILTGAYRLVPRLEEKLNLVISSFAGLRPEPSSGDFIIKDYEEVEGFINVAGIKSPGLTSAPAIAETVAGIINKGNILESRSDFDPNRKPLIHPLRNANIVNTTELLTENPSYRHVVCRCERVTEGEIIEALHRGAGTLDGIKYRTRAGMGRCQGGFCAPHIIGIISRELKIPVEEVTKKGRDSNILRYSSKELLSAEKDV